MLIGKTFNLNQEEISPQNDPTEIQRVLSERKVWPYQTFYFLKYTPKSSNFIRDVYRPVIKPKIFLLTKDDMKQANNVNDLIWKLDPYRGINFLDDSYDFEIEFLKVNAFGKISSKNFEEMNEIIQKQQFKKK